MLDGPIVRVAKFQRSWFVLDDASYAG